MAERKKTIGPVTAIAIEVLDKRIRELQTQLDGLTVSLNSSNASDVIITVNLIKTLNDELINKFAEKNKRNLEQNRLINHIANCLGQNGGVLGGVQYEACCPLKGACTCAGSTLIDVLVTFDSMRTTVTDGRGNTIAVVPLAQLCANADFCQEDHLGSNPSLNAFAFAPLYDMRLDALSLPESIVIDGISYPLS